jgi:ABC-2 type transport system ATP-binding protein
VDDVSFRLTEGRVIGFLGPNGAGKTTTIRMVAAALRPTSGTVIVGGLDVLEDPAGVRRNIGYLPENTPLYPEMRVIEFLQFRARLYGLGGRTQRDAVLAALQKCDLYDVRRRPIRQLSKGFRQRVGLAAAIVHRPPLIILDEPTSGLDPQQVRGFRALMRSLAGDHTVLLSTHVLPEVELACDDVVMISGGKVRAHGAVDKLRAAAHDGAPYVVETDLDTAVAVLASLPSIDGVETRRLTDGWLRLSITARGEDRRMLIARTLRKQGAQVRELTRPAPTLEQLFVQVVTGAKESDVDGDANGGGLAA